MDIDVAIAGAGPAGTSTAARLVRLDPRLASRVVLFDREHFPRAKPCGGGLTGRAELAMAELGFELRVAHAECPGARVRFSGFERTVALAKPVRIVRREDFDASLVEQVRELGVSVCEGEGIADYEVTPDRVVIRTTAGRVVRARCLVGADGAASVVRKRLLGGGARRTPHRLFRLEMSLPAPLSAPADMVYDFSLMRDGLRGYLWIFPVPGGRVNVGLMHYPSRSHKTGGELVGLLSRGLADYGIELPARSARGWPAWGYHPASPVSGPRVLTVGDAAGIDGLTGEGIAVAMEQAVVAGEEIAAALAADQWSFARYRGHLRRAVVGRELALDRWLARLLYRGRHRWRTWLSLVLFDPEVLRMYAARVSGTEVLADRKAKLCWALARHIAQLAQRRRRLAAAASAAGRPLLGSPGA